MENLNKTFVKGNVLKAEELNEIVSKVNELVGASLVIGTTEGTAYDGAAGAELEQTVKELANITIASKMVLVFISSSTPVTAYGQACIVRYSFSSTIDDEPTGPGTVTYTLNNKVVGSANIEQGENAFDVGKYLSLGDNTLVVQVTDSFGNSRKLTYAINAVTVSISSTFDDTMAYKGDITFPYTPIGAIEKTIRFLVDGAEIGTVVTSVSNRQQTYAIPMQGHGAHSLEVYITATVEGTEIESEHLYYEFINVNEGNNTPIIASSFRTTVVEQFSTLLIPYLVYNPAALTSSVTLSANGEVISNQMADRTLQTWSYRVDMSGALTLRIASGSVSRSFTLTVNASEIDVQPETADLALFLTSVNRSNNESADARKVWSYNEIFALLTAFNWATNGWIKTIEGFVALRVNGDARVTIPYNSFANDFRSTGKTLEFEFETRDVTDYDAIVLSCMNDGVGLEVTAQKAVFKSQQTTVETQFKEDEHIRVSFVVEKRAENRLIYVYVNGEMCGVVQYPEQDNFTQGNPVGISIGNDKCTADLFNIRVYDNNLNRYQLLDNYIADMDNLELKQELYVKNNIYNDYGDVSYERIADKLPVLTIIGRLPAYKGDKVTCKMIYVDRQNPVRSWSCDVVQNDVQGTSSQYYPRKNYKFKFKALLSMYNGSNAAKFPIREGDIPVDCFCTKADFAEASGCHNTGMARLVDFILRGLGQLTPPQKADARVRTTIDGYPIVIFHQEAEDSEPTFLGKYNFNNDKSTQETFGFTPGCECWEIRNNTSDRVLFKSSDYSTDDWLNDFEARYPEDSTDYTKLKRLTDWLVSVKGNPDEFKSEASEYLNMDFMLSYYVLTEFFAMVDQRAKNVFLTTFDGTHWLVIFYDNDTCLGINNEGVNAFDFTVEYHDKIGTQDVWNGEQSTLWNNIEQAYKEEIAAMYADMRKNGLLTYEQCDFYLNKEQCDKWSEAIYNEDGWFKYVQPLLEDGNGSYLYAAQGSRKMHRVWWLYNRFKYMDSKYIAGDYMNDFATMRLYTPTSWAGVAPNANITITSYAGQYVNVKYGSYVIGGHAKKNVPITIQAPDIRFNDTETIIYGASQISSLGDLSGLYAGTVDVSKMTKLTELIVGSGADGYKNTNLTVLSVGANDMLRKLDIRNCPNLTQAIELGKCSSIREVWAEGTGTTAVVLPEGGDLSLLHLPDTITSLTIMNQINLTAAGLVLDGVQNLSTIRWENTNSINPLSIVEQCFALDTVKLDRVRLIGVDWFLSTLDMVVRLTKLKGLDEQGNNTDTAVVTGKCYVTVAMESQLNKIKAAFPELVITYGQLKPTPITTFTFSSSAGKSITNAVFTCNVEYDKVNEYTYKVAVEDGTTVNLTFECDNHKEISDSYLTASTRTQIYTVPYIPLRTIRVKVYGQSVYVPGANVIVNGKSYITDSTGSIMIRTGEELVGEVSAYGYTGNTFSFGVATNDATYAIEVYAAVDVKFVVTFISAPIVGAKVKIGAQEGVTNQYGECILPLGRGNYEYTVTHPEYLTKTGNVAVGTSAMTTNVSMLLNAEALKPAENGNIQMLLKGTDATLNITSSFTDYVIDWGDGTSDNASGTGDKSYNHTYGTAGHYQVEVRYCDRVTACNATNSCLVAYWGIGNSRVANLNFTNFTNFTILSYVGLVFKNDNIRSSFSNCFYGCSSLTSIPAGLFDNCPAVTSFTASFRDCSSLTNIPAGLFDNCPRVTSFSNCFYGCRSLTSIPAGLFDNCPRVTSFSTCFSDCSSLTNIPAGLFDNCPAVTSFTASFRDCSSLTNIPAGLFDNCPAVTDFSICFYGCSSLTNIPAGLFDNCPAVTSFTASFRDCIQLQSFVSKLIKVDSSMFNGCRSFTLLQISNETVVPMINTSALTNTGSRLQIKVPANLVEAYKVATNWVQYASKISAI